MAKRELIYKDEARRAVLQHAPGIAWSIDNIKPVMVIDDKTVKPYPQMDEFWIARIQYWPETESQIDIVMISYSWKDGTIDFIPFYSLEGDIVRSTACAQFELLERIEMERYK
jgi:hypothetical protein